MKRLLVVVAVLFASLSAATAARAQTTTTAPCGSGTNTPCGFDRSQDFTLREGESVSITNNTGFMPGAPGVRTFNGQPAGGFNFPATGSVNSTVTVLDDGIGPPTNALGAIRPLFAAVGLHLAQATRAPILRIDNVKFTGNAIGVRNALVVQGQAADTGQGRWTNYITVLPPAGGGVGGTGLGRTGTMIARWSLLGSALLAVGVLLVLAARRRRTA